MNKRQKRKRLNLREKIFIDTLEKLGEGLNQAGISMRCYHDTLPEGEQKDLSDYFIAGFEHSIDILLSLKREAEKGNVF